MTIHEKLIAIQSELKVPKAQMNKFGNYKYRSCEDILEAVKPLANKKECHVTLEDEMVLVGDRVYVKATATLEEMEGSISRTAYAREAEDKKGMDDAQITGSASSYARKYALNGLFAIDDTKDADATNDHKEVKKVVKPTAIDVMEAMTGADDIAKVTKLYTASLKYKWNDEESKSISDCKTNCVSKFLSPNPK